MLEHGLWQTYGGDGAQFSLNIPCMEAVFYTLWYQHAVKIINNSKFVQMYIQLKIVQRKSQLKRKINNKNKNHNSV